MFVIKSKNSGSLALPVKILENSTFLAFCLSELRKQDSAGTDISDETSEEVSEPPKPEPEPQPEPQLPNEECRAPTEPKKKHVRFSDHDTDEEEIVQPRKRPDTFVIKINCYDRLRGLAKNYSSMFMPDKPVKFFLYCTLQAYGQQYCLLEANFSSMIFFFLLCTAYGYPKGIHIEPNSITGDPPIRVITCVFFSTLIRCCVFLLVWDEQKYHKMNSMNG